MPKIDALDKVESNQAKYHQSPKGKKARKKYQGSEKGKEARNRYFRSEKGQGAQLRYRLSLKGKKSQERRKQQEKFFRKARKWLELNPGKTIEGFIALCNPPVVKVEVDVAQVEKDLLAKSQEGG